LDRQDPASGALANGPPISARARAKLASKSFRKVTLWVDAVEKRFSVQERRRIFHERLPVENIDSGILHLGFYYCPSWTIHRSLIDFFNSIGQSRPSRLARKATYDRSCPKADIRRAALRFIVEVEITGAPARWRPSR